MHKRPRIKLMHNGRPLEPTPLNTETAAQEPSAVEATQNFLLAPMPANNLLEILEQRTWENGQLRQDLAKQQAKNQSCKYLLGQVKLAMEALQEAVVSFQILNRDSREEDEGNVPPVPPKRNR